MAHKIFSWLVAIFSTFTFALFAASSAVHDMGLRELLVLFGILAVLGGCISGIGRYLTWPKADQTAQADTSSRLTRMIILIPMGVIVAISFALFVYQWYFSPPYNIQTVPNAYLDGRLTK